jgi:hypothetical protein
MQIVDLCNGAITHSLVIVAFYRYFLEYLKGEGR